MEVITKPTKPVCSYCESDNILADAYAEWSHEKQEWIIQDVFHKHAFCNVCEGECSIEWIEETA